jgi:stage IV sporulation protein FB
MGFEDRDYYRGGAGSPTVLGRIGQWILYGRISLFRIWGIHVQAHSTLLIAMVLTLLFLGHGYSWQDRVIASALLFVIVLLHEFGHCFGARWSGGDADQIVMHPLGGLALTQPQPTWQSHLITSAAGPAVNVVICILCGIGVFALTNQVPWQPYFISANPLIPFRGWLEPSWLMYWLYQSSWALLLFNLLPVYPLDGGRITQELLWPKLGYYRSMLITTAIGMVGCVLFAMVGIATGGLGLVILAILGFMMCMQMRRQLQEMGPYGFTEMDDPFAQAMHRAQRENRAMNRRKSAGPSWSERRAARRAERERQSLADEEAEIDRILAKVSASGMHSLSRSEQKTLKHATERKQTGRR